MKYSELALIEPLEEYKNKENALSIIKIVTGTHAHRRFQAMMPSSIFTYNFWGSTFEVVTYNDKFEFSDVRDIEKEDFVKFNLGLTQALTFNEESKDVLATNGFVYPMNDSLYAKYCPKVWERILNEIRQANNFTMQLFTYNGAVIDICFDKDVKPNSTRYKKILTRGFVTTDKTLLRTNTSIKNTVGDTNAKMNQEDIDKLVKELLQH